MSAGGGPSRVRIEVFTFGRSDPAPNHPTLSVILYRAGITFTSALEPAAQFEARFAQHRWPPSWRNGVYSFHHYHTTAHEVLGIAFGSARLLLGGSDGETLTVFAGDAILLPAGTGHCCLQASADFLVVGAYPPGQEPDLQREAPSAQLLARIKQVPLPEMDPLLGPLGPVHEHWIGQ